MNRYYMIYLYLLCISIYDIKYKEFPYWLVGLGFILGWMERILFIGIGYRELLWACVPGGFLIAFSLLCKEHIGTGDGFIVLIIGLASSFEFAVASLLFGMLAEAVTGIVLMIMKKITLKTEVPFIPFLSFGGIIGGYVLGNI